MLGHVLDKTLRRYIVSQDEFCQTGPNSFRGNTMTCVFVQLQCMPGQTYSVADQIYEREIISELYSTSGEFDLLMKIYVPKGEDIGKYIHDHVLNIPGIARSLTTMTFTAF